MYIQGLSKEIQIDDASVMLRILEVNSEPSTLEDFLYVNMIEDGVEHISIGEAKEAIALNVGETLYIGHSVITRTK